MEAAGQKEYDHGICQGCQQPFLERDLWVEVPTMGLLAQETTWEEIMALYHQVYQLKRNPREVPCSEDTMEETCLEILEMLKECLWHRWGPTQPERELRKRTSRMPAQAEFQNQAHVAYDHFHQFWNRQQESQKETLWVARDAHCWVLATAAILEGHIQQLSQSVSHGQHGSWGQLGSHWP